MKKYKCDVCGRELNKAYRLQKHILCKKHHNQLKKHGKFLDNNPRTVNDLNDYKIDFMQHVAYFNVYNQKCEKVGTFKVDLEDIEKVKYHRWRFAKVEEEKYQPITGTRGKGGVKTLAEIILDEPKVSVIYVNNDMTDARKANLQLV